MMPLGDTIENIQFREKLLLQTNMNSTFLEHPRNIFGKTNFSQGRSVYMASELGSNFQKQKTKMRLGGHKQTLRALKNVKPYMKK